MGAKIHENQSQHGQHIANSKYTLRPIVVDLTAYRARFTHQESRKANQSLDIPAKVAKVGSQSQASLAQLDRASVYGTEG